MTALPDHLRELPTHTPSSRELDLLELLLDGALGPVHGFMSQAEYDAVRDSGALPDGTRWTLPIGLAVPNDLAEAERIVLTDPEGSPLALLTITSRWADHVGGSLERLRQPEFGPFRSIRPDPSTARTQLADRDVVGVVATAPPTDADIAALTDVTTDALIVFTLLRGGSGWLTADVVTRSWLAVRDRLPAGTLVVPAPVDPDDLLVTAHIAYAYGVTRLAAPLPIPSDAPIPGVEIPAYHDEHKHLVAAIDADTETTGVPAEALAVLHRHRPPKHERGLTIFFTGLSGSGKSTVARGLYDALVERDERTVSMLDGDVVRQMLSAGLTFSRADRNLNIRRIGYVAAEVTRHGGLAICAPIAPYAATRQEVRDMVTAVGDFLLIHISTPLEVCEQRDRKGLYAKARAGLIKEFTGISDPYETPTDADLAIDTSQVDVQDAVAVVIQRLVDGGYLEADQ